MFNFLLIISAVSAGGRFFGIDIYVSHKGNRVGSAGTNCQLYCKNGNSGTKSKKGPENHKTYWEIQLYYANSNRDTWLWTSCGDALLIDQAGLSTNGWTMARTWGVNGGGAWCLSTDPDDGKGFSGKVNAGRCYRTLLWATDGNAYYYTNDNWTPGRRSLAGLPTLEDVHACEQDESKVENGECADLVDKILSYDQEHLENLELAEAFVTPQSLTEELIDEYGGESVAMVSTSGFGFFTFGPVSAEECAVYALAGVGLSVMLFHAVKFAKKKKQQAQEFTPLQSRDEL